MVERIDALAPQGGASQLGFIEGSTDVDPGAWFFAAHFHQDPVWPGSLGLEAMLQLLKVAAAERWPEARGLIGNSVGVHRWQYRGQVIPSNRRVSVQAVITGCDDEKRMMSADGSLEV